MKHIGTISRRRSVPAMASSGLAKRVERGLLAEQVSFLTDIVGLFGGITALIKGMPVPAGGGGDDGGDDGHDDEH